MVDTVSADRVLALRGVRHRLSIISGAEQGHNIGITGTNAASVSPAWLTARIKHVNLTGKAVSGLRVVVSNYGFATTSTAGTTSGIKERNNGNAITVKVALEFAGTAIDQQQFRTVARFGGQSSLTLTPYGSAYSEPSGTVSDELPGSVSAGATFYERAGVQVATGANTFYGGLSLRGGTTGYGTDSGEGDKNNSSAERVLNNSAVADVDYGAPTFAHWSSTVILGHCADGTVAPSIAIFGDSIVASNDDAAYGAATGGWALRAFAAYPHVLLACPGERGIDTVNPFNSASRLEISKYATHVLWAYGRNDISYLVGTLGNTSAVAVATIKAAWLAAALIFMRPRGNDGAPGQTFIVPTVLPAPGSTDGWLTVANQTKDPYDAARVLFNQWIRDTSASGFVAQANAQVASIANAGVARIQDPCAGLEVNAAGVLTTDGGYALPATTTFDTGTSTGTNTTTALNDTGKAWATNVHKGRQLFIVSGTGSGQSKSIAYNTATQLVVKSLFSPTPDATSVYRITDASGWDGVHPGTVGAIASAASINAATAMA